jgi:hypothetical protein
MADRNDLSGSIKDTEFVDLLSDCQLHLDGNGVG